MVPLAWFSAYWLRFNLETIPADALNNAEQCLPFVVLIQVSMFWLFGLYRGVWRFSSLPDLIRIAQAALLGMFLIATSLFLYNRLEGIPRSVLPIYLLNLLSLLCLPRLLYRLWKERRFTTRIGQRTLIVGAGSAGEMLVRDLLSNSASDYIPVIFVDDNPRKINREIRGIRVAGTIDQIPNLVKQSAIESILIAIPSAGDLQMRRIVEICESCQIAVQTLPSVNDLLSGQITKANLRKVSIEDILGRDPVKLDWQAIRQHLHNKTIIVTGGGGSIGSELCKQLAKTAPKQLIVFDQCEFNLYKIDAELKQHYPDLQHLSILGDVSDPLSVNRLISQQQPDIIFHAAAYKHVPLLENQAREAVHNNLIGTKILAEAAIQYGVSRFVLISTDKAVNPTNIMGATKRAAEILCQNLNVQNQTQFITVRFGNVLDSAGSVVPLFRQQIASGGPVTVTHPDITRYFMTIPEACQLIMQAETVGKGGEVFVLDMGEPIKIAYLAEQMIRLSGKKTGEDIQIEFVGLRPGEKLYEELFHSQEPLIATDFEKLRLAKARLYDKHAWETKIAKLENACQAADQDAIIDLLSDLVPEFKPAVNI